MEKRQIPFDEGLDKLEAIVQQLESGSLCLEEALKRFEEGIELSKLLQMKLSETQRKVEILKQGLGGEYKVESLNGDDAEK